MSLLLVRRMTWSTIVHHVTVCIFNVVNIQNNYEEENVCRLIFVYAVFSTFAYLVNLLLASRFLSSEEETATIWMSYAAFIIYGFCLCINWVWQIFYIIHLLDVNPHWSIYVYSILILVLVYDDLVLERWLYKKVKRGVNFKKQH